MANRRETRTRFAAAVRWHFQSISSGSCAAFPVANEFHPIPKSRAFVHLRTREHDFCLTPRHMANAEPVPAPRNEAGISNYNTDGFFDEMFASEDSLRPHYRRFAGSFRPVSREEWET